MLRKIIGWLKKLLTDDEFISGEIELSFNTSEVDIDREFKKFKKELDKINKKKL